MGEEKEVEEKTRKILLMISLILIVMMMKKKFIFLDDQVEVAGRAYPTLLLAAEK